MTTKNTIGALVTAITAGTINTAKAEEQQKPSVHGVVETLGGYSTKGELTGTVDAIGKVSVADHLMFFGRYRGTPQWNEAGFSYSDFSVENVRFPNLAYGFGIVLERQQAGDWNDYRVGIQHVGQIGSVSTYALATGGETFVEGIAVVRYQREVSDITFFAQAELVGDISYKGDFLFATERPRIGIQKEIYSLAVAADIVQTKDKKIQTQATIGLAGTIGF